MSFFEDMQSSSKWIAILIFYFIRYPEDTLESLLIKQITKNYSKYVIRALVSSKILIKS